MEECSVLIESTLPAEDKTSRWFNLPIDYELFRDLLGVEADSGDYQIIDMKLPFAGDIVRTTSVRRLNKLYFAYTELPPEVQQAYNDLIPYCGGVEDLLQKSEIWIKNSGHNSNTDQPNEVNRLIEKFISEVDRRGVEKKLALTSCYYSVAFVLVHRVP